MAGGKIALGLSDPSRPIVTASFRALIADEVDILFAIPMN